MRKLLKNPENSVVAALTACLLVAYGWIVWHTEATFGMGDSISHYLLARHAWGSPELLLDHWAKPLFQLMMVLPAQLGFKGVVMVNALCMLVALAAMADIARRRGIAAYPLVLALGLLAPLALRVTLSSLTEPVFAAFLSVSIWCYATRRFAASAALLSFLPFVRTEGMVYLLVWVFALVVVRRWRALPWLLLGFVLYALAGWIWVYGDPFWFFTEMPYMHNWYGSGTFTYYYEVLYDILGIPILALLILGILAGGYRWIRYGWKLNQVPETTEYLLIYGVFLSFVTMHATFWYVGRMGSAGEIRILVSVVPLAAFIALRGLEAIRSLRRVNKPAGLLLYWGMTAYVVIYPFTPHEMAWRRHHFREPEEIAAAREINDYLATHYPGRVIYTHWPALRFVRNAHPRQDPYLRPLTFRSLTKPGNLIVWESWFAPMDHGIEEVALEKYPLQQLKRVEFTDWQDPKEPIWRARLLVVDTRE
ncbi:MAG: hypothetical protein KF690_01655 [Bacteroidetes bacterium]|nr:hypothetical protein [Bacteroidota bacterium]